jgi:hypothetical protein
MPHLRTCHYWVKSLEVWKGVTFLGLLALALAFFMPWITVTAESFLGSASFSYSMIDFFMEFMTKSTTIRTLQPMFGTIGQQNLPIDRGLELRFMIAISWAMISYIFAVLCAVASLIRKDPRFSLISGLIAIVSFVSALLASNIIKEQVIKWGQMGSSTAQLLNYRLDIGQWITLLAGFILVGSCFLSREMPTTQKVPHSETTTTIAKPKFLSPTMFQEEAKMERPRPWMFCKECGARIPRDSKFCKECGARLATESS